MPEAKTVARGDELDSRGNKRSKFWSVNTEPSETVQSQANESEIEHIMKRFKDVGIIENLNQAEGMFLDITQFEDYADAMRHAAFSKSNDPK